MSSKAGEKMRKARKKGYWQLSEGSFGQTSITDRDEYKFLAADESSDFLSQDGTPSEVMLRGGEPSVYASWVEIGQQVEHPDFEDLPEDSEPASSNMRTHADFGKPEENLNVGPATQASNRVPDVWSWLCEPVTLCVSPIKAFYGLLAVAGVSFTAGVLTSTLVYIMYKWQHDLVFNGTTAMLHTAATSVAPDKISFACNPVNISSAVNTLQNATVYALNSVGTAAGKASKYIAKLKFW